MLHTYLSMVGFSILLFFAVTGITLTYASLAAITRDVDDARVYGGIHFRFDQEVGAWQGSSVAAYTVLHHLRPVGRR